MWGGIGGLVIQAGAGGVCANIAGELLRKYDLGAVGNTISGIIGGGLSAQFVGAPPVVPLPICYAVISTSARSSVRPSPARSAAACS